MLKRIAALSSGFEPFQPESGAYGGGHKHGHDETFSRRLRVGAEVSTSIMGMSIRRDHEHAHDHGHDLDLGHRTPWPCASLSSPRYCISRRRLADRRFSYSQGLEAAIEPPDSRRRRRAHWIASGLTDVLARGELPLLAHQIEHWRSHDESALKAANDEFLASRESAELQTRNGTDGLVARAVVRIARMGRRSTPRDARRDQAHRATTAFAFAALRTMPRGCRARGLRVQLGRESGGGRAQSRAAGTARGTTHHRRVARADRGRGRRALDTSPEQINTFAPQLGVLSARHESQYSRLFRS